ncbi:APC family permease [Anaerorhabdus sp.]|uniref:APC family permease n=1 Tax=Anaerorhabdus sp. TaxID=1872524 RepID=UPI002FC59194
MEAKKIGFASIFLLGINGIIGSGIFLLPGKVYKDIGVASLIVILIASIMVFLIALCYAELSSKFSENGAAWRYVYEAFGKFFGFEVGISVWFLAITSLSAETAALMTTLQGVFPQLKDPMTYNVVAVGFLCVLFLANMVGTNFVKILNNISSVAKIAIIVFFIGVGIFFIKVDFLTPLLPSTVTNSATLFSDFAKALGVIFYAFVGFSFLPVAAAKMDNPKKNVPLALITVLLTSTALYILITAVSIGLLGPQIANESLPAAVALQNIMGTVGYHIIIYGMIISIGGLTISFSFNAPFIASSLAEKGLFPKLLAKKNKKGIPYISSLITFGVAIILVLSGDFMFLISLSVFISFIQYVPSILALIKLRKKPSTQNGFKVPGGYIIPILALLSSAYLLTSFTMDIVLFGIGLLVIGAILYWIGNRNKLKQ